MKPILLSMLVIAAALLGALPGAARAGGDSRRPSLSRKVRPPTRTPRVTRLRVYQPLRANHLRAPRGNARLAARLRAFQEAGEIEASKSPGKGPRKPPAASDQSSGGSTSRKSARSGGSGVSGGDGSARDGGGEPPDGRGSSAHGGGGGGNRRLSDFVRRALTEQGVAVLHGKAAAAIVAELRSLADVMPVEQEKLTDDVFLFETPLAVVADLTSTARTLERLAPLAGERAPEISRQARSAQAVADKLTAFVEAGFHGVMLLPDRAELSAAVDVYRYFVDHPFDYAWHKYPQNHGKGEIWVVLPAKAVPGRGGVLRLEPPKRVRMPEDGSAGSSRRKAG